MNKKTDININLEEELEKLKKEAEDWKNKYLRALADYQNLEKRVYEDRQENTKYASEKIIHELLVVYDTLEKAKEHLKDTGLSLGVDGLWVVLKGNGIKKIEVLGKKFDPNLMECVEVIESGRENEVIEEVRTGYMLWDKVIRVAQVKVGKKLDNKEQKTAINKEGIKPN